MRSHTEKLPRWHWSHSPQMIVNGTTTRSPTFSLRVVVGPDLDDLAHELVAHDVAVLHAGHEAVVEMQVGAADRATRHLDDGVSRMLDLRIRNLIAANVLVCRASTGPSLFFSVRLI